MNLVKFKSLIWLMAGVLVFSACKDDEETETPTPTLKVSSITTTDGTDLYGATSATSVGTDQNIIIGFSATVRPNSVEDVKLKNGDNTVASSVTASGSTVTINPTEPLFGGTVYTVQVSGVSSTDGATSENVSATFTTAGIGLGTAPQADKQILYLQLNSNLLDVTGKNAAEEVSNVTYAEDRFGVANNAAYFSGATAPGNGNIIVMEGPSFVNPSTTISTWFKVDHADFPEGTNRPLFGSAAQLGFFLELGNNLAWMKMATDHVVSPDPAGHQYATAWGEVNGSGSIGGNTLVNYEGALADVITSNVWHQLVMSYDKTSSIKAIYIDGQQIAVYDLNNNTDEGAEYNMVDMAYNSLVPGFDGKLAIGFNASNLNTVDDWNNYNLSEKTFKGSVDDFRMWNVGLTQEQVSALYIAEKP